MNKIIAMPSLGDGASGKIVFWPLSSDLISHDELTKAWAEQGLPADLLLSTPEPEKALSRAVVAQRRPQLLIQQVKGAWVLTDVRTQKGTKKIEAPSEVDYIPRSAISLNKIGRVQVEPFNYTLEQEIREAFERGLGQLERADISLWLSTKIIPYVRGVCMKPNGGMYFIPKSTVAAWDEIVAVIKSVSSHKILSIPAMESKEAVEALLYAIEQEAEAEADYLEEKLADESIGVRAIQNLETHAGLVIAKVAQYEEMLGVKLEAITSKLHGLKAQSTVAAGLAWAKAEKKA